MGKSSPIRPAPVDQGALIDKQAEVNRVTEFTPLGDRRFGTVGSGGQFVPDTGGAASRVDLSPEALGIFNTGQETTQTLADRGLLQAQGLPAQPISFEGLPEFSSELDFSGLPALQGGGDFSADASRVEDASFQRALGLLNPEFERQEGRLRQTLANQGLPIGGEAFEGEFDRFDRGRNEALNRASLDAVGAGRAEQSRLFGLSKAARGQGLSELLQQEQLARTARQQGVSERTGQRGSQFGELASLLGLSQANLPQFNAPSQIDVLGPAALAQSSELARFNAEQQSQSGLLGGLFGLGGSAITGAGAAGGFRNLFGF